MINFTYSYQTNQSNDFNGTMKRRDFLKTAAVGSGWMIGAGSLLTGCNVGTAPRHNTRPGEKMKLSFEPYELQLRHTFTVASYSRTTTPDVQVEIAYDGWIGYGEASMPLPRPDGRKRLAFLRKVDLSSSRTLPTRHTHPVDSLSTVTPPPKQPWTSPRRPGRN